MLHTNADFRVIVQRDHLPLTAVQFVDLFMYNEFKINAEHKS